MTPKYVVVFLLFELSAYNVRAARKSSSAKFRAGRHSTGSEPNSAKDRTQVVSNGGSPAHPHLEKVQHISEHPFFGMDLRIQRSLEAKGVSYDQAAVLGSRTSSRNPSVIGQMASFLGLSTSSLRSNSSMDSEHLVTTLNNSSYLEQHSQFSTLANSRGLVGMILSFSLAFGFIAIVLVTALLVYVRVEKNIEEVESDREDMDPSVSFEDVCEDLVRRLSQTVWKLPLGKISFMMGSFSGMGWKERHVAIWWDMDRQTWGSTRLGWWENERDLLKKCEPLNSIFLKYVHEVRVTDQDDKYDKPGVCIVHKDNDRLAELYLFFAGKDLAEDYAEDLRLMIKKVKYADAAERGKVEFRTRSCSPQGRWSNSWPMDN